MGQTLKNLASGKLSGRPIFPNRFVVEICEKVHTHYKNVRMVNTMGDWLNMAEGFKDSIERWKKRGCPSPNSKRHIELCRKKVTSEAENDEILVNLNKNLYPDHEGLIFSEGAEFTQAQYVHFKIGDVRIELSVTQFLEVADVVAEAKTQLENSDFSSVVQKA